MWTSTSLDSFLETISRCFISSNNDMEKKKTQHGNVQSSNGSRGRVPEKKVLNLYINPRIKAKQPVRYWWKLITLSHYLQLNKSCNNIDRKATKQRIKPLLQEQHNKTGDSVQMNSVMKTLNFGNMSLALIKKKLMGCSHDDNWKKKKRKDCKLQNKIPTVMYKELYFPDT